MRAVMVFLGTMVWSVSLWAEADLARFAHQLQTFQADFVQETPRETEELMGVILRSGRVVLKRPGKLYWHYRQAGYEPQTIVVDGRALWLWDPELEQVTVQPLEKVIKELPLSWLLYDYPLQMRFYVRNLGVKAGLSWFELIPKQETYFQAMEVGLDEHNALRQLNFYQSQDRVTRLKFSNVKLNEPVDDSLFYFRIPEGADLVGELPK